MIRPITMICWILALSAGLYLYRAKHEVGLMDRHIEQIAKETNDLRVESRRLLDDWIRLGEPEQLRKYSDQYLGLKAVAPTQFVRLSDLAGRLPAPRADPVDVPPETVDQVQVARSASDEPAGMDEGESDALPVPPIPPSVLTNGLPGGATLVSGGQPASAAAPAVIAVPLQARPVTPRAASGQQEQETVRQRPAGETRLLEEPSALSVSNPTPAKVVEVKPGSMKAADTRPATLNQTNQATASQSPVQVRGVGAPASDRVQMRELPPLQTQVASQGTGQGQQSGSALRPVASRVADAGAADRQREIRPVQPQTPPQGQWQSQAAAQPAAGSLLGMSRGGVAPLPAPTPVNATWSNAVGR
jgi:hypothetical protein